MTSLKTQQSMKKSFEKRPFRLNFIGFSESQMMAFLAILSLAERALQHSWHIAETDEADFFILATEKPEADSIIQEKNLPRERCLFCTQQVLDFADYDTDVLFITPKQVPLLSSIVKILNHAANSNFSKQIPLSIDPIVETSSKLNLINDPVFNPNQGFLKPLLQNTSERLAYGFGSPTGIYKLYVDPVNKVYYCETSLIDLSAYLIIKDVLVIDVISETQWQNAVDQLALPAKSLANLIWYITFKLSNGRLLSGHSNQDSIYLTRWPDLGIEGCGQYVKLAAFMRNNAVCLTEVAAKTATPLSEVYNFYNACYLIGIVEKTTQPEFYAKDIDENKQQILAKITNRLKEIKKG